MPKLQRLTLWISGGTTDQLGKARNERDQLWQEVKSSIEERDVDELLLARYEESVDRVDCFG